MSLTVEDGTGLSNADAFVSLADFKAYCDARGQSYSAYEDTDLEPAIRRASYFLTNSYRYQGRRVKGRSQSLAWPRYNVYDATDPDVTLAVAYDSVPQEIVDATCEVALREAANPGSMNPDVTLSEKVKMEKVGQIAVEYANFNNTADASRPVLLIVRDMIGHLLAAGTGNSLVGVSSRS